MFIIRSRRALTWGTAAATTSVLALAVTSAAFAAPTPEVTTPNMQWIDIYDDRPTIADVQATYPNLLGTGVALDSGWTADAFDDALQAWQVTTAGGVNEVIDWTPGTQTTANGLSTWTYSGTTLTAGVALDVSLEIQGNTARWTVTPTAGPADAIVTANANLGSDGDETVVEVTPETAVVTSDDDGVDPVLGFSIDAADGLIDAQPGAGGVDFSFATARTATIVAALQDYAPCAEQVAIDGMIGRVATLQTNFGITIEGALDCATVAAPAVATQGTATSQVLAVGIDPAVDAVTDGTSSSNIDFESGEGAYLEFPDVVESTTTGLPAGLTATFDPLAQTLTLAGTPTQSGVFNATLVLYRTDVLDYWNSDLGEGAPVVARFTVTVAPVPTDPGTGGPGTGGPGTGGPGTGGTGTGGAGAGLGSGTGVGVSRSLPEIGAGDLPAGVIGLAMLAAGATAVAAGRRTRRA